MIFLCEASALALWKGPGASPGSMAYTAMIDLIHRTAFWYRWMKRHAVATNAIGATKANIAVTTAEESTAAAWTAADAPASAASVPTRRMIRTAPCAPTCSP